MIGMSAATGMPLQGIEHLRQSISDILTTPLGSRIMRRTYGSLAFELIDRAANATGEMLLKAVCADALAKWEPRLRLKRIALSTVTISGGVEIDIDAEYIETGVLFSVSNLALTLGVSKPLASANWWTRDTPGVMRGADYVRGLGILDGVAVPLGAVSVEARDTVATLTDADGMIRDVAANVLAVVKGVGCEVFRQQTNYLLHSEEISNQVWQRFAGAYVTANQALSPKGDMTADLVTLPEPSSFIRQISQSGVPDGNDYASETFLKAGTITAVKLGLLGSGAGLGQTYLDVTLTSEWQRLSQLVDFAGLTGGDKVRIRIQEAGELGNFYMWGGQVSDELGPYIPTTTAPVTRAASDVTAVQGFGGELNTQSVSVINGSWTDSSGLVIASGSAGGDSVIYNLSEPTVIGQTYRVFIPNTMPVDGFFVDFGSGTDTQIGALDFSNTFVDLTPSASSQIIRVGRWSGSPVGNIGPVFIQRRTPFLGNNPAETAQTRLYGWNTKGRTGLDFVIASEDNDAGDEIRLHMVNGIVRLEAFLEGVSQGFVTVAGKDDGLSHTAVFVTDSAIDMMAVSVDQSAAQTSTSFTIPANLSLIREGREAAGNHIDGIIERSFQTNGNLLNEWGGLT